MSLTQETITIRPAQLEDAYPIKALLEEGLGKGYMEIEDLNDFIDPQMKESLCLVATSQEKIIGALTLTKVGRESLRSQLPKEMNFMADNPSMLEEHSEVGFIQNVVVSPAFQRQGIATRLIRESLEQASKLDLLRVISFGWESIHGCHIDGVFADLGFKRGSQISGFWYEESIREEYECPSCGNPCYCNAILYSLELAWAE